MTSHWKLFRNFTLLLLFQFCTSAHFYWVWYEKPAVPAIPDTIRVIPAIPDRIRVIPAIPDAVTYQDIERLNATCSGLDSCKVPRTNEAWKYNCNCDEFCNIYRTCCADSKYKRKHQRKYLKNLECRKLNNNHDFLYPLISSCNPGLQYDKTTEELCLTRGVAVGDPFMEIPVTDPMTGITYTNYFCFACNENSGEERLIPWNVAVGIGGVGSTLDKINKSSEIPTMQNYERDTWEWVADKDNSTTYSIWPAIPEELENVVPFCYGYEIHSECASDWRDINVRRKCQSYMAMTRFNNGANTYGRPVYRYYRNPHCAICNYENLDNMVCVAESEYPTSAEGGLIPSGDFFVRIFSLHDKAVECKNKMVYDKFLKKCRNIYKARKLEQ